MMVDCDGLAAELSRNYRNTSPFDKAKDQLSSYLTTHGILLTMCFPSECTVPFQSNHISGSWINQLIGPEVIMGPAIGLALNPSKVEITCLYPTDGATETRDDAGCGPFPLDPINGSRGAASFNWITRSIVRKQLTGYKNFNFGFDRAWEDILCDYFFPAMVPNFAPLMWQVDSEGEVIFESLVSMLQKQHEAIMGHPVCTCPNEDDLSFATFFVLEGNGWDPLEWQEMVEMQLSFKYHEHDDWPSAGGYWNEIVMAVPSSPMQDVIEAVFFIDSASIHYDERAENLKKANDIAKNMFGGKPVMRLSLDAGRDDDILDCPKDAMGTDSARGRIPQSSSQRYTSKEVRTGAFAASLERLGKPVWFY